MTSCASKQRERFFPAPVNAVLPLQPGCQETKTWLQKVLCHPSLLGGDLRVQKPCLLGYEKASGASVDIPSDQRAETMSPSTPKLEYLELEGTHTDQ